MVDPSILDGRSVYWFRTFRLIAAAEQTDFFLND
jgi:hypothetical protein